MRRTKHSKSRLGCKECKTRHVKCDESRPRCIRCQKTGRDCSFGNFVLSAPSVPWPLPPWHSNQVRHSATTQTVALPQVLEAEAHQSHDVSRDQDLFLSDRYSLVHMELLDHFQKWIPNPLHLVQPLLDRMMTLVITEAFTAPYLMDQLLCFAAAHKSTLTDCPESQRRLFATEATRLQTRALSSFTSLQVDVTEDNCVALMLYSSLLGQHVLFDVFSSRDHLSSILDGLVQCLGVHRGIRTIASAAWPLIRARLENSVSSELFSHLDHPTAKSMGECDPLTNCMRGSQMGQTSKGTCNAAIVTLQYCFDSLHQPSRNLQCPSAHAAQDWLVRVPTEFGQLLTERRPEALMILGYYAVLLHRARDYWPIGESGQRLFKFIRTHLGESWGEWLVWPRQEIIGQEV